jgi:hypothetical protein
MIPVSSLAGRDDELADLIGSLQTIDRDTDLIAYPIAKLAEARRTRIVDLAVQSVAELAAMVRRDRAKVWNSGGVLPWDWHQIAVDTWPSLSQSNAE